MGGMYNNSGSSNFSNMFGNWQQNMYNRQVADWQSQQQQYQDELGYWDQMNQYDQDQRGFDQWSTGAGRMAPITPRQKPGFYNPYPTQQAPMNFDFGGMFGGGGGWSPTAPPGGGGGGFNYGAFDGPGYQAGSAWDNPGIDTAGMVDPSAVIASAQPGIMENMNNAFADAGNRFGSSGMVGTPYAGALGEASRGAANDIANITNQYQFQAAQSAAEREQQRALAEYGADYNAWAQQGDWAHQGQLADMGQNFGAWGQMGDWQNQQSLNNANIGNQQWMAQNDWGFQQNQQNQNQQNQWMQQFLPMMMQMMGGGY